jgi:Helix-turn-helix domain
MPRKIGSRLLDTEAASALLGCSPAALAKFRTERRGPAYVRVGKLIRYRRQDLVRWVRSQRVSPERAAQADEAKR